MKIIIKLPKHQKIHDVQNPPISYTVEKFNLFYKNELVLENAGRLAIAKYIAKNTRMGSDNSTKLAVELTKRNEEILGWHVELSKVKSVFMEYGSPEYKKAQESWEKTHSEVMKKRNEENAACKAKENEISLAKEFEKAEKQLKKQRQLFTLIESHDTGLDYKNILQYETEEDFRKMQPWYILSEDYQIIDLVRCKDDIRSWVAKKENLNNAPSRQTIFKYIKKNEKYLGKYFFKKVEEY